MSRELAGDCLSQEICAQLSGAGRRVEAIYVGDTHTQNRQNHNIYSSRSVKHPVVQVLTLAHATFFQAKNTAKR